MHAQGRQFEIAISANALHLVVHVGGLVVGVGSLDDIFTWARRHLSLPVGLIETHVGTVAIDTCRIDQGGVCVQHKDLQRVLWYGSFGKRIDDVAIQLRLLLFLLRVILRKTRHNDGGEQNG